MEDEDARKADKVKRSKCIGDLLRDTKVQECKRDATYQETKGAWEHEEEDGGTGNQSNKRFLVARRRFFLLQYMKGIRAREATQQDTSLPALLSNNNNN